MKELKTLKDLKFRTYGFEDDGRISSALYMTEEETIKLLKETAKEWIKELEHQKELHAEWICKGIGEHPNFDYPEGFLMDDSHYLLGGYDEIINWIKYFFNLEEE